MFKLSKGVKLFGLGGSVLSKSLVKKRNISYALPSVALLQDIKVNNQDFSGLFSNNSVTQLWHQRGEKLVDELNHLIVENKIDPPADLVELIALTFNKPELSDIYSRASMLYNIQFFFEGLLPNDSNTISIPNETEILKSPDVSETVNNLPNDETLKTWLIDSFGSMAEFKTLLLNSAKGIKGDGYTWLVAQPNFSETSLRNNSFLSNPDPHNNSNVKYSKLSVMNTYNAGIVDDSIRSGQVTKLNQQKQAKLTLNNEQESSTQDSNQDNTILGSIEEAEFAQLYSDKKLVPLLAIDASPRNYLLDYGIFGKQKYLDNVWGCIDWNVVLKRAPPRFKQSFEINF